MPFAGEAERSDKRGYCAAFNEALPVEQRLEALQKVCALAFAFSAAHIKHAALHSVQRFTAHSVAQRPPPSSIAQRPALHCTEHSEPRQGQMQQPNQAGCAKGVVAFSLFD